MSSFTVRFLPQDLAAAVSVDTSLLDAAGAAGLQIHSPCGGRGKCGKCAVRILSGPADITAADEGVFDREELALGWRLACSAKVTADLEVEVPPQALLSEHRIAVDGLDREVIVEPNIQKLLLRLPAPSPSDPRADLWRVTDALGPEARPAESLRLMRHLPRTLRDSGFQVTAVLAADTLIGVEAGDTSDACYGLALDIGTTTLVAHLCHLPTGEIAASVSDLNPQARYGEDVISRITVATQEADGLSRLHDSIIAAINALIRRATTEAGVAPENVYELAAVGNTCMLHLLLGVSPVGLSAVPFVPAFRNAQVVRAEDLGLGINPDGLLYAAPSIGGFVGADTVAVIIAADLDRGDSLRVAVDIGTNGEIVVADGDDLYACSTAAGPAFEGARISRGMRAASGAIEAVHIDGDVTWRVIGDEPPRGLCGSGLVDAVAELLRLGAIQENGRLLPPEEAQHLPEKVRRRLVQNQGEGVEFILAHGDQSQTGAPITLTARDVREVQLAKGAILAGITMLLELVSREVAEVQQLLLAGAFGNYIRPESAAAIGLLPALPPERLSAVGNAAGVGARLLLSSAPLRRRAEQMAARVMHVELSEQEGFYDRFAEAIALRPLAADAS